MFFRAVESLRQGHATLLRLFLNFQASAIPFLSLLSGWDSGYVPLCRLGTWIFTCNVGTAFACFLKADVNVTEKQGRKDWHMPLGSWRPAALFPPRRRQRLQNVNCPTSGQWPT